MLVSPHHAAAPHTLSPLARSINTSTSKSSLFESQADVSSSTRKSRPRARRPSPPSLQKQVALAALQRCMEQEKQRQHREEEQLVRQAELEASREHQRRDQLEREWAEENQEVSIIVTSWDDDKKCWWPVEAYGPVSRELRMFLERRRLGAAKGTLAS